MSSSTERARAVVLALLMVGSVFGATIAFTGGAAATINDSTNTDSPSNASDVVAGYDDTQTINVSATVPQDGNATFDINVSNISDYADVTLSEVSTTSGDSVPSSSETYNSNTHNVSFKAVDDNSDGFVSAAVTLDLDWTASGTETGVEYGITQYNNSADPVLNDTESVSFDVLQRVSSAGHPADLARNDTTQNLTANGNISITNVDANDAVVYVNMTTLDENGVDVDSLSAPSKGDVSVSGGTYSGDGSLKQNNGHTVMILPIGSISGESFNITKLLTGGDLDVSQASLVDGLKYPVAAKEGTSISSRFNPNNDNYAYEGPAYGISDSFDIIEVGSGTSYIEQSTDNVTTADTNATVNVTFVDDAGVNDDTINVSVSDARNNTTQLVRNGQLVNGTFEKNTIDDTNSTVEKTYVSINLSDGVYTINASAMDNGSTAEAVGNSPTTFGSNSDPAFSVKTQTSDVDNAGNVDSLVIDPDSGKVNEEITASATISTTGKDTSFALDLNDDGLINESEVVVTATDGGSQDQEDSDNVVNVSLDLGNYSLSGMNNVSVLAIGEDGTSSDTDSEYAFDDLVEPDRTATYNITGDNTGPTFAESTNDVAAGENVTVNVSVTDADSDVDNSTINVSVTNSTGTTYSLVENGAATDDSSIVAVVDPSSFNDSQTNQTETVNITADLPEGTYTIGASASDELGNSNESDAVGDGFTVGSPSTTVVTNLDLTLNRTKLVANGTSVIKATATLTNTSGDPVSGHVVKHTITANKSAVNVTKKFKKTDSNGEATLLLNATTARKQVSLKATAKNTDVSNTTTFGTIPTNPTYDSNSVVASYDNDNDGTISSTELQSAATAFRGGSLDMSELQSAAAAFAS